MKIQIEVYERNDEFFRKVAKSDIYWELIYEEEKILIYEYLVLAPKEVINEMYNNLSDEDKKCMKRHKEKIEKRRQLEKSMKKLIKQFEDMTDLTKSSRIQEKMKKYPIPTITE